MSAKTTAEVNIVNADIFVQACQDAGIKTTIQNNTVVFGEAGQVYHNCKLGYNKEKETYFLDGDSDTISHLENKAMALYNCMQLQHDLNESGRYRVVDDSVVKVSDAEYRFQAEVVNIGIV